MEILIRTGIEQAVYICQFVDAATHGERNIDFRSNPFHQSVKVSVLHGSL